jgi:hypothetical protein
MRSALTQAWLSGHLPTTSGRLERWCVLTLLPFRQAPGSDMLAT